MQDRRRKAQPAQGAPALGGVLEAGDVGHIAGQARLEQPVVALLVPQRRLRTGAAEASGLQQAPAQLRVDRRLLRMQGSQLFDDLLQLRQPGRGQRRHRWLRARADSDGAPAVGIACQNQVARRRRVLGQVVLPAQQVLAPAIRPGVAQDVVQAAIARRGKLDIGLEGQVHWIDRPAQTGVGVTRRIPEIAAAFGAGLVAPDRHPRFRVRALEIDKQWFRRNKHLFCRLPDDGVRWRRLSPYRARIPDPGWSRPLLEKRLRYVPYSAPMPEA